MDPQSYVEAIADETLQDVFDDVDQMLDKGAIAHVSSLDELDAAASRFSVTPFHAGSAIAPIDPAHAADGTLAFPEPHPRDSLLAESPASSPEKFRKFLATLSLMVTASVVFGVGLAFWMAQHNKSELVAASGVEGAVNGAVPPTPNEFAEGSFERYFQDALATIDRRYEQEATAEEEPVSALLPTPPPPPPSSSLPLAVDRGYIDVYQQPQVASAPTAPTQPAPSSTASAPVQNIAPSNTHTLVGILELGDRSAAIFEYSGAAHRIEVGEQIGGSGWSLVSVSGQEAIIRRNGEVRSIYMEQSF
jgi:hypothetical protein